MVLTQYLINSRTSCNCNSGIRRPSSTSMSGSLETGQIDCSKRKERLGEDWQCLVVKLGTGCLKHYTKRVAKEPKPEAWLGSWVFKSERVSRGSLLWACLGSKGRQGLFNVYINAPGSAVASPVLAWTRAKEEEIAYFRLLRTHPRGAGPWHEVGHSWSTYGIRGCLKSQMSFGSIRQKTSVIRTEQGLIDKACRENSESISTSLEYSQMALPEHF